MNEAIITNKEKIHKISRTILRVGAAVLIELHFLWVLFMHVIGDKPYRSCIMMCGRIYLAAALVYLVYSAVTVEGFWRKAVKKLKRMYSPEWAIVLLITLWYFIACTARENLDGVPFLKYNTYRLFITVLAALLMFPFAEIMGMKRVRLYFDRMMHLAMLAFTPFCAWAVWKYAHLEIVVFPTGNKLENFGSFVSLMIGNNRNTTGAQAFAMLCVCVYMLVTKKGKIRIAYIPATAVHFLVLILSNSRTSYVALVGMVLATVFVYMWRRFRKIELKERILRAIVPIIVCTVLFHASRSFILTAFDYIPVGAARIEREAAGDAAAGRLAIGVEGEAEGGFAISLAGRSGRQSMPTVVKSLTASQGTAAGILPPAAAATAEESAVRDLDLEGLNGRPEIWKACIQLMFSSPDKFFFGVMPTSISKPLNEIGGLGIDMPDAHNGILQIGVSIGVPAMILYIVFLILLVIRCIRLLNARGIRRMPNIWVLSTVIFGILLMDMTETRLFAGFRANLVIFYILAGWVVYLDKRRGSR